MTTTKRTHALTAHGDVDAEASALEASVVPVAAHTLAPAEQEQRDHRFSDGVRSLRIGGATFQLSERILLVLAGIVAPLGLVLVLLGYLGVSQTPFLFEQMSYLISGGVLGLALVFLGSFFYFAHWLTQLVKEHRSQSAALLEAIQRLQDEVVRQGEAQGQGQVTTSSSNGHHPELDVVVATVRGTMAHRPDCVVVAGKADLRWLTADDGLSPCKLCEPY